MLCASDSPIEKVSIWVTPYRHISQSKHGTEQEVKTSPDMRLQLQLLRHIAFEGLSCH